MGQKRAGVPVVITFRMGEYSKYWIGDGASDERVAAAATLMDRAFPSFAEWGVLSPIRIENLGVPFLEGYRQFRALTNAHRSESRNFSHSRTNGFRSSLTQGN